MGGAALGPDFDCYKALATDENLRWPGCDRRDAVGPIVANLIDARNLEFFDFKFDLVLSCNIWCRCHMIYCLTFFTPRSAETCILFIFLI